MAKITNLKPQLRAMGSRIAPARDLHGHSAQAEPWRNWYSLKAWHELRDRVFIRDNFTCQCGCGTFIFKSVERIADHRTPHRGDRALFFDDANVQTLWKPHHDGWKQRQERADRVRRL